MVKFSIKVKGCGGAVIQDKNEVMDSAITKEEIKDSALINFILVNNSPVKRRMMDLAYSILYDKPFQSFTPSEVRVFIANLTKFLELDNGVHALYCYNKLMHDIETNPGPDYFSEIPPHFEVCYCEVCTSHASGDSYLFAKLLTNFANMNNIMPLVHRHFNTAHKHRLIFYELFKRLYLDSISVNKSQGGWDPIGLKHLGDSLKESVQIASSASEKIVNKSKIVENFSEISSSFADVAKKGLKFDFGFESILEFIKGEKGKISLLFLIFLLELLDRALPNNCYVKTLKYMVVISSAVYYTAGPISEIFSSWVMNRSQADFSAEDWISTTISVITNTVFNCSFPLKQFSGIIRHCGDFIRNFECIEKFINRALDLFSNIIIKGGELFGYNVSEWFYSSDNKLKRLQKECSDLMTTYLNNPLGINVDFAARVSRLNILIIDMIASTKCSQANQPISMALSLLQSKVFKLQEYVGAHGYEAGQRDEPAFIPIAGAPGCGKTYFSEFLGQFCAISVASPEELAEVKGIFNGQIYVWPPDGKYHDTYTGEYVILFPDLFSQTDSEGMPSEATYLIYLVGGQPLVLPAAEITKKQRLWVTSKVILAATNVTYIAPKMFKSLRNDDASKRRMDEFGWYQWVNPKYALKKNGKFVIDSSTNRIVGYENQEYLYAKLDKSLLPDTDEMVDDVYFFRRHNFTTGRFADDKIYSWRAFNAEVSKFILKKKNEGEQRRRQLQTMSQTMIKERLKIIPQIEVCDVLVDPEFFIRYPDSDYETSDEGVAQSGFEEEFPDFPYTKIDEWFHDGLTEPHEPSLTILESNFLEPDQYIRMRDLYNSITTSNVGETAAYTKAVAFANLLDSHEDLCLLRKRFSLSLLIKMINVPFEEIHKHYIYWVFERKIRNPVYRNIMYLKYTIDRTLEDFKLIIKDVWSYFRRTQVYKQLKAILPFFAAAGFGVVAYISFIVILVKVLNFFFPPLKRFLKVFTLNDGSSLSINCKDNIVDVQIDNVAINYRHVRFPEVFPISFSYKFNNYVFDGDNYSIFNKKIEDGSQSLWKDNETDFHFLSSKMDNFYLMYCNRVGSDKFTRHPCNLVFLGERIAVGVRHVVQVFRQMQEVDKNSIFEIQLVKFIGGNYEDGTINYRWDDIEIFEDEELSSRDLVIFKFKTGKLHSRIEKMIPPKKCLEYLIDTKSGNFLGRFIKKPTINLVPVSGIQQVHVWMNYEKSEPFTYTTPFEFNVDSEKHKYFFKTTVSDKWALRGVNGVFMTEGGDCTSPCFLIDERKNFCVNLGWTQAQQPWLCYLHTSIQGTVPIGSPIYREMFQKYFDMMHTNISFLSEGINRNIEEHEEVLKEKGFVQISQSSFLAEPEIKHLDSFHTSSLALPGFLSKPVKSEIKRSALFGNVNWKPTRYPSRLADYVSKKTGEIVSVMPNARLNYGSNKTNCNSRMFSLIINDTISRVISDSLPMDMNEVLTNEQVLLGDSAYNLSGVNWQASAGFYFRYARNKFHYHGKGKTWMQNNETLTKESKEMLLELLSKAEDRLRKGDRYYDVFIDNLKDELLPLTKGTRLFCSSGFIKLLLDRKYFGAMAGWIFRSRVRNGMAVGVNPYSDDWDAIYAHLLLMGDRAIFGDYSKFDKKLLRILMEAVLELSHRFYNDYGSEAYYIRILLFEDFLDSIHVTYDEDGKLRVYSWNHGNTSGNFLTATINCMVNILIVHICLVYCFLIYEGKDPNVGVHFYDFWSLAKDIRYSVLGDDLVLTVRDKPYFTFNSIKFVIEKYIGLDFTDELKGDGEVPDYRSLCSGSFLGRKFYPDHFNGRPKIYCPLRLHSVLEAPQWIKGKTDPEIEIAKIEGMNLELAEHQREVFEKYVPTYAKMCFSCYGRYPMYTNYDVARARVIELACYAYSFDTFLIDGITNENDSEKLSRFFSLISID